MTRVLASTCKECSVRCGSLVHVEGERVVKVTGNPAHPGSHGAFCIKGAQSSIAAHEHPDRILYPLKRAGARGAGQWQRVSWDEALDAMAGAWIDVKQRHDTLAIAGAVSNQYGSRGVAMSLALRSIGSPNYMINQDLCQGCRYTASLLSGVAGKAELEASACVLVVGKSPSDSDVLAWMQIKAAKRRGAKLIVIDPRRTPIAKLADLWLPARPGTDAALALAMIHVMFTERLIDEAFVAEWCTGADRLRERAARYAPETAAAITGLAAADIVGAARLFGATRPASLVLGHGIDAQANGVRTTLAFHALLAISGNLDRPGGNRAAKRPAGYRDDYGIINDAAHRLPRAIESQVVGAAQFPLWSGPDAWAKTCHNPSLIRAIGSGDPYPVRALYVSGVNIVCTYPDVEATIAALGTLDSLVVATDVMTPTAEFADLVLPKTTSLEEEDVFLDAGGPCISIAQRAVRARGETRTDLEIAIALVDRLRARGAVEYEVLPWRTHREYLDHQLAGTAFRFEALQVNGFAGIPFEYEAYRKSGFRTPSGKIELAASALAERGLDPLPDYVEPAYAKPEGDFDLVLLTGIRSMAFHHSRFRDQAWARKIQDAPELRIHPDTARRAGVADGDWVWVETPRGARRVHLKAWVTDEVPPGIVGTGMGWWYPERPGADHGALQYNVDAAIPYGPPWDPISGSAEARNVRCRIGRVEV